MATHAMRTLNLYQEITKMKDEYDFSNAEQGKFYILVETYLFG